jgi:hypothetical protein
MPIWAWLLAVPVAFSLLYLAVQIARVERQHRKDRQP